jgi:hypothetical protein
MNHILKLVKDVISDTCITIILNTHRTKPDKLQDPLALKNLVNQAKMRLQKLDDKEKSKHLIEKLEKLSYSIDHTYNQESLLLFVNESICTYTRLPISVGNRVVIDKTFATRDLIRAMHQETNYFILVLSEQQVRLIEAMNDKVVQEIGNPFPIINSHLFPTSKAEKKNAQIESNRLSEFFNQVDKEFNAIHYIHPLPLLICSEASNYHEFKKIADNEHLIFPVFIKGNHLSEKGQVIAKEAWKVVKKYIIEKENKRLDELEEAISKGNYISDLNEIWEAIPSGQIQTLFLEESLFQSAQIKENNLFLVGDDQRQSENVVDDIYDEIIEANMNHGGEIVFVPDGSLKKHNGFAAITRY